MSLIAPLSLAALFLAFVPRLWRSPLGVRWGGLAGLALGGLAGHEILIAVLAPFGTLLPALALQPLLALLGLSAPRWATRDLIFVLILLILFFGLSLGGGAFDPYRFGYDPRWGSAIALLVLAGLVGRGQIFLALATLLGQIMWSSGIGPENIFNQLTHVLLLPIVAVALIRRACD